MTFKQKVFQHYQQKANDKVVSLQTALQDLIESTKNETKSSAGDKYETSRAMLQIEQDNVRKQLKDALGLKAMFDQINPAVTSEKITLGSLIKTDKGYFFISVALGKSSIDGVTVIALSPQSPLGRTFLGLKVNQRATVNATTYSIDSIE